MISISTSPILPDLNDDELMCIVTVAMYSVQVCPPCINVLRISIFYRFLNSVFEVMHGRCPQQMFIRGSVNTIHFPHEHPGTFELELPGSPITGSTLCCPMIKFRMTSGSAIAAALRHLRNSPSDILSTTACIVEKKA